MAYGMEITKFFKILAQKLALNKNFSVSRKTSSLHIFIPLSVEKNS